MIPPHLASRPVWHGLPVPYINCWNEEVDEHQWRLKYDPLIDQMAWFTAPSTVGEGRAYLAKQNLQRQREVVMRGQCQVCRRTLRTGPRWLLLSSHTSEIKDVAGEPDQLLMAEPWLCPRCLVYTIDTCPGIRRRQAEGDLLVYRCDNWDLVTARTWHDDYGPDVVGVTWVKIRPLAGAVLSGPITAEGLALHN